MRPAPKLPDPTPPQELPKGHLGKHYTKEKAVSSSAYDRYAWKSEVANIEIFLHDLVGERCYYVPRYEDGKGYIVNALAKHGPNVWCRLESGEICVVDEMHLHSVRNT